MFPRLDVSLSATIAAVSGLLFLAANYFLFNNPVGLATLPTLLVVASVGIVAYLVPTGKEIWGTVAGGIIVIIEAYLSSRTGDPIDSGSVIAAITYFVNLLFLWVLPRVRVITTGSNAAAQTSRVSTGPEPVYELRRDSA